MDAVQDFKKRLTDHELRFITSLNSPIKIQSFLDEIPYRDEDIYRCPLSVIRDSKAHCFDGALFAATTLRAIGHPPFILEMLPNARDDSHLIALYKIMGHWGAVAKSNFVGLRFREPVYLTLRELIMSYFEQYYNIQHEKTLRSYRLPLNLKALDRLNWMVSNQHLEAIVNRIDNIREVPLITEEMAKNLSPVDERAYQAGLLGANKRGLYNPDLGIT